MRHLWGMARAAVRALKQQPMTDDVVFAIVAGVGVIFGAVCRAWGLPE